MEDEQENQDELKVGDSVWVKYCNIDGMCGDGIYGDGKITSIDTCRNQITVEMRDQNFPSYYKEYTVPSYSVTKTD